MSCTITACNAATSTTTPYTLAATDDVQEGAARGYNPSKRGRASHHPLMAFVADTRMIANCWLRPGNAVSAHNVQGFLANTLHRMGRTRPALLRADSGFCDSAFLDHLDVMKLHHIVPLRQTQPIQRALVNATDWWALRDEQDRPVEGIELVRFQYQANSWSKARWVIGIRQRIKVRLESGGAKGKTLQLFADDPVIGQYRSKHSPPISVYRPPRSGGCIEDAPTARTGSRS